MNASKIKNGKGQYPWWCGIPGKYTSQDLYGYAELLFISLSPDHVATGPNKVNRELLNGIFHCLERLEGKEYFTSIGFKTLTDKEKISDKSVVEHVIPVQVLQQIMTQKIKSKEIITSEGLLDFIRVNYAVCLISKVEDMALNKKYKQDMPKDWWEDKSNFEKFILKNPLARYIKMNINF